MLDLGFPIAQTESSHGYSPLHNAAWSGSDEDIWSVSTIEKIARNPESFPDAPLGGRGIVVLISRVDIGAVIEQQLSGGEIASEMKGSAPSPPLARTRDEAAGSKFTK